MCPPREGGPRVPPLPPLPPRRPLGGPLLRGGGGGPRLPLSNDGLVACSTLMAFPSKDFPFMSLAASLASAGLSKVTKAKPLDLLVSRSFIKSTSTIRPYLPNTASRAFSFVSVLSPPMKSFPGRSASTIFFTPVNRRGDDGPKLLRARRQGMPSSSTRVKAARLSPQPGS